MQPSMKFALLWRACKSSEPVAVFEDYRYYKNAVPGTELVKEHRFHEKRKWRFDFAIPDIRVAIEIEGGSWVGGRHTRGAGYAKDCEKYNTATELGWRVFRLTSDMVNASWVKRIIEFAMTKECRTDFSGEANKLNEQEDYLFEDGK